ncbi:hypothetical protein B1810_19475 [Panacagrimonas perspica]|uniref:response regulator transcription factor n=1 Tax=Panacagrimonas perspica TaxID=381431 RepID=UPI00105C8F9B|nr:LuxR C-terminal-related transcriptional regulator [Panacagrimonas perspica]THD01488.1 hypothetical protein B1810_19475 [Panacagrimonas perspica]
MTEPELLSPREGQAIELLSLGHSNKEIAQRLCLSENTVKFHLKNAYRKLVIRRRVQAARVWRAQVG